MQLTNSNNLNSSKNISTTTTSKLSNKCFNLSKSKKDYKIEPKVIPRPNFSEEIYKNEDNLPIYKTNETNILPPFVTSYYIVNETENSSPRLVRSSLNKLPCEKEVIDESGLVFALYFQPFAQSSNNSTTFPDSNNSYPCPSKNSTSYNMSEKDITKVQIEEQIFRCKFCKAYINSKFKIKYKGNIRSFNCNICFNDTEIDINSTKLGVKLDYFKSTIDGIVNDVPELNEPTIDFKIPLQNPDREPEQGYRKVTDMRQGPGNVIVPGYVEFAPHYIFLIDVTLPSHEISFCSYVRF